MDIHVTDSLGLHNDAWPYRALVVEDEGRPAKGLAVLPGTQEVGGLDLAEEAVVQVLGREGRQTQVPPVRLQVEVHEDDGLLRVGQVQRLQVRQLL